MRQKRRSLLFWAGVALVSVCLGAAIFGPYVAPFGPNETLGRPYSDPSAFPPFGLDYLGRDAASRLLWGGRTALFLALVSTVLGLALAVIPALMAAFHRGWIDAVFNRTTELLLSFPIIVLVLLLVAGFGTSLWLVVAAVAVGHAPRFARLVRGSAIAQRDLGYVEVAEARGESSLYIVLREILPNLRGPLGVEFGVRLATSVALMAGLSFLGVGVQPPAADWGLIISENRNSLLIQPWAIIPAVAIIGMLTVGINLSIDAAGSQRPRTKSRMRRMISLSTRVRRQRDDPEASTAEEGSAPGPAGDQLEKVSSPPDDRDDTVDQDRPSLVARGGSGVLQVTDLTVHIAGSSDVIVEDITISVRAGEVLAVVGESGSGKTTVGLAVMGYARTGTYFGENTSVRVVGQELLTFQAKELQICRLESLGFVAQDPASSLSPGMSIGRQVAEVLEAQQSLNRDQIDDRVRLALEAVQLPSGEEFLRRYPHELSGGQQQRVVIAMALIRNPIVIVLDEPTTALDVTIQQHILELTHRLIGERNIAALYISHDLSVVRHIADRVAVMYGGRVVEETTVDRLFEAPVHPYTRALLEASPRIEHASFAPRSIPGVPLEATHSRQGCPFAPRCGFRIDRCDEMPPIEATPEGWVRCWQHVAVSSGRSDTRFVKTETPASQGRLEDEAQDPPLLKIHELHASYGRGDLRHQALSDVSLRLLGGSSLGVVGETGSGKTTLLRCIAGLHIPDQGKVHFAGETMRGRTKNRHTEQRRRIQLIPQNPYASLNPRHDVLSIVARPLRQFFGLRGAEQTKRATELLDLVKLPTDTAFKLPSEMSGGERQRVAIARALAANPDLLLCDEITSALDVSVQAGILELLRDLRMTVSAAIVFVSHDLAVVQTVTDNVAVLNEGQLCEVTSTKSIFEAPEHPYTEQLIDAIPRFRDTDYPVVPI